MPANEIAAHCGHHDRRLRPPLSPVSADERATQSSGSRSLPGPRRSRRCRSGSASMTSGCAECVERLHDELDASSLDAETWRDAKLLYIGLLVDHKRPELAETFFNSVVTRVLRRTYVHNDFTFVRAAVSTEYIESDPPNYRSYYPAEAAFGRRCGEVFGDFGWSRPFADLDGDVGFVCGRSWSTSAASGRASSPTTRCRCSARLSTATRPRTSSGRSSTAPTRRRSPCPCSTTPMAGWYSTRRCSIPRASRAVRAVARLLHGGHGRAVGLRPVPAVADAGEAPL